MLGLSVDSASSNIGLELGLRGGGKNTTPYIDFYTDGSTTDYNSRILASGDNLSITTGSLILNNSTLVDTDMKINTDFLNLDTTITESATDLYIPTSQAVREALNGYATNGTGSSSYYNLIPMMYGLRGTRSKSASGIGYIIIRVGNQRAYKLMWGYSTADTSPGGTVTFSDTYTTYPFNYIPLILASASQGSDVGTAGFRYISPYAITTTGFSYTCSDDETWNTGYMRWIAFGSIDESELEG